jgi:DOPA 4,5-dioxygenase
MRAQGSLLVCGLVVLFIVASSSAASANHKANRAIVSSSIYMDQSTAVDGTSYFTSHSFNHPISPASVLFDDPEIKEWHFHVYWFQTNKASFAEAMALHDKLLKEVARGTFVVIFHGVTAEMVPGLNVSNIPHINTHPIGPHPCGSFEVWTPKEYFAQAMSWFMRNRGELSILLHPLSRHEVEDHTGRSMWLGPPFRLDLTVLTEDLGHVPLEYPELGLGYSAKHQ